MPDITIICCYNNEQALNSMLVKSLGEQIEVEIETIFLNGEIGSAAKLFNYAIKRAQSKHLAFIHQDMMLTQPDFLKMLVTEMDNDNNALYGLCGTELKNGKRITYSNVFHGLWNRNVGRPISQKQRVSGLDEIFVAFHKDLAQLIRFDEVSLNGWHLYVEDICLSAQLQEIPVYVLPLSSQHKSILEMPGYIRKYGILPKEFFKQLRVLREKYKGKVSHIICPCVSINISPFIFWKEYIKLYIYHKQKQIFRDWSLK